MPNALVHETSPYLLQHADNPVDWLPWGEAAFSRARAQNKPIFLSIGYSTCHWCHVMAHESFESPEIAQLLNEHFIPVKVDREERPDVDKVYMAYVQAMTGHGGWPLSSWLTPELKPFYGGTYFPPDDRHGRPGFSSILQAIARGWRTDPGRLATEGERTLSALREYLAGNREGTGAADGGKGADERTLLEASAAALGRGFEHFYEAFDAANGGFGGAPKFPRASNLNFLFRVAALQGPRSEMGADAIKASIATLRAMARGGIHDHVGGGYHRYSVDEAWFVPHFEKMLYDQAQIAVNFLEAKQATGDERFAWMARDIFTCVLRDLQGPEGGFYTAEDADSAVPGSPDAHAEGAFYVWTRAEIVAELGGEAEIFCKHFCVEENGNVPPHLDPQGEFKGKNILVQGSPLAETASHFELTPEQANDRLFAALERIRALRSGRPRPLRDDKVLTANNGLMISALARAHQVIGGGESGGAYLQAATRAAEFLERELYARDRGVLFRTWRGNRGTTEGFAEDYAFLIQGLLDLHEASFDLRWLQWSVQLQAKMDELFWDDDRGGYFNSAAGDASILLRLKEDYDGAEPAPSSVAAMNLLRMGALLDQGGPAQGFRERGRQCIDAFRRQWAASPQAMPQMLCALELALEPPRHIVFAGDLASADFKALAAVPHERLGPRRVVLAMPAEGSAGRQWLVERAPWLAEMRPRDGRATAYVCEEYSCQAPVTAPEELRRALYPAG